MLDENKYQKESKWRKIGERIFRLFTYSIYIRIILQSFIPILLSWISEIYELKVCQNNQLISFLISVFTLILTLVFFVKCILHIRKPYSDLETYWQFYLDEFFSGLKNKTSSRLLPAVFMGQRILSWFLLILFVDLNLVIKMSILTFIQAINLVYLIAIRPYELIKDLILETMSQAIMTFFSWVLIYFNSVDKSTPLLNWIFIGTLMLSSVISTLISFIDLFITVKNKIKSCPVKNLKIFSHSSSKKPQALNASELNVETPADTTNKRTANSEIALEEEKTYYFSRNVTVL